jgi:hypothetical protein
MAKATPTDERLVSRVLPRRRNEIGEPVQERLQGIVPVRLVRRTRTKRTGTAILRGQRSVPQ